MKAIFNFFAATSQEYQRKELWELMKAALSTMNEPGTALDLTKKLEALLCTFFLLLRDKEEKDGEVKLESFPAGSVEQIEKERNEMYQLYDVMNEHRGRIKRLTKLEIADPYLAIKALFAQHSLEEWSKVLSEWCEYALSKMTLMDVMYENILLDVEHLEKMLEVAYLFNKQYGRHHDKDDGFMEQLIRELNQKTNKNLSQELLKEFIIFIDTVPPERLNRNIRKIFLDYLNYNKDGLPFDFKDYLFDLEWLHQFLDVLDRETRNLKEKEEER